MLFLLPSVNDITKEPQLEVGVIVDLHFPLKSYSNQCPGLLTYLRAVSPDSPFLFISTNTLNLSVPHSICLDCCSKPLTVPTVSYLVSYSYSAITYLKF